jgi:hypothetical protein
MDHKVEQIYVYFAYTESLFFAKKEETVHISLAVSSLVTNNMAYMVFCVK